MVKHCENPARVVLRQCQIKEGRREDPCRGRASGQFCPEWAIFFEALLARSKLGCTLPYTCLCRLCVCVLLLFFCVFSVGVGPTQKWGPWSSKLNPAPLDMQDGPDSCHLGYPRNMPRSW